MVLGTGVGSMPGDAQHAYEEAVRLVLGELAPPSGLPFLPEVPGRGAGAAMTGRTLGLVSDLDADLQPAGWRLTGSTGAPGVDQRRARSLLAQDLDFLEEQAEGLGAGDDAAGFKVQVCGPWTLAATVERPRGDAVLGDHGARRELAQALAEAVRAHVADLRRRLPDVTRLVVQVDEPALPAVLAGAVPTASGLHRHRTVHPPEASETLGWVLSAVVEAGAEPWVHCCAGTGLDDALPLLRRAGARGLLVDLELVGTAGHDELAAALEAGETVGLGVVATTEPTPAEADGALVDRAGEQVLRWLDRMGLDPATSDAGGVGDHLVVSPGCGLAGASPTWARRALAASLGAARQL